MDAFSKDGLEKRLSGSFIGRTIHFLETTDSTNTVAFQLACRGAAEGEVVIADRQTQGRGRIAGRHWQSPPGRNLYASIILRPPIHPSRAPSLTLVAGVAVAQALAHYCPKAVSLKWPNDVLINKKKVSGILTEMRMDGDRIDHVIVGIGINILMDRLDFEEAFRDQATSLKEEAAGEVRREEIAIDVFRSLESWYRLFLADGFPGVREQWLSYSGILNSYVEISGRESRESGTVLGIDEEGYLLIRDDLGNILKIISGDVLIPSRSQN